MQMLVALIVGIHRDRRIAQHRLRTRRRHRDKQPGLILVRIRLAQHRIPDFPQFALLFFMYYFKVADRRLAIRAPVHDVHTAIDQPLLIQPHKGLAHCPRQVLIHREVFARPIDARPQPLHLLLDRPAEMLFPLPHALLESLAADLLPALALALQLALDEHLRRDSRVVRTGNPQCPVPEHAMPANEDVRLRVLEHVTHVQVAGHVGRREEHGEDGSLGGVLGDIFRRRHIEQALAYPIGSPAIFNRGGVISFLEFVGHSTWPFR